jgi:hypothetical protein
LLRQRGRQPHRSLRQLLGQVGCQVVPGRCALCRLRTQQRRQQGRGARPLQAGRGDAHARQGLWQRQQRAELDAHE